MNDRFNPVMLGIESARHIGLPIELSATPNAAREKKDLTDYRRVGEMYAKVRTFAKSLVFYKTAIMGMRRASSELVQSIPEIIDQGSYLGRERRVVGYTGKYLHWLGHGLTSGLQVLVK